MMGTELVRHHVKEESVEMSSIPPGFESLTSFTLKREEESEFTSSYPVSATTSESKYAPMESGFENSEDEQIKRSVRRRPGKNYGRFDSSSGDEPDSDQNLATKAQLPKGVVHGCEECSNCQKVTARWHPEAARRPDLQDAPVFYPSEEEFEDTLNYIASIRERAEGYGICRIVPPPSWKPPCPLKEKNIWENSKFTTRIQRVDKLQNRNSVQNMLKNNSHKKRKRRRCMKTGVDNGTHKADNLAEGVYDAGFGFEPGPVFTLDAFQNYANDFKSQYFRKNGSITDVGANITIPPEQWEPSVENIEGEYWRMVENATEEIEVLYGADLETGVFGSGFPKLSQQDACASEDKYVNSGWNLNNFPRLPGSVLSYESSDISGVLVPWLYIGMCLSSFCWHVEDHHLYSMNYLHWGAPKMWYGVPGKDALKLEAAMRKHLPDLFEEQPDLLHKLVTQLSPSILKSEGVPVFRCIQNPGEFVLTFPRSYHSGFNCGFNCAEAVNVAPVDWLPHGQNAIELYREQGRKTSISHDKLLLGAARDAVKAQWEINLLRKNTSTNLRWKEVCGKNGILSKALKGRVEMERVRREFLCNSSQALKMESSFDATSERECSLCFFDLHLSAAGCHYCSPDKYACLNHAKQFCSCSWAAKFFLFRYDVNDLNILVEALEGKLSAIYRWAKLDLGLALSSFISKDISRASGLIGRFSYPQQGVKASPQSIASLNEQRGKETIRAIINSTGTSNRIRLVKKENSPELIASKDKKKSPISVCKTEESVSPAPISMNIEKSEVKKPSFVGNNDIILLSDDEGDDPSVPISERAEYTHLKHGDNSQVLADLNNTVGPVTENKDQSLATTVVADLVEVGDMKDATLSLDQERNNHTPSSVCAKDKDHEKEASQTKETTACNKGNVRRISQQSQPQPLSASKEPVDCNEEKIGKVSQEQKLPPQSESGKSDNEENIKIVGSDANSRTTDNVQTAVLGLASCNQNNLDRYYRQKGPRIAKVVRRFNCHVQVLQHGIVRPGKFWCDSRAIYPKGFRSRVRYISVLDPTDMCFYVSDVVDTEEDRPLFRVYLENCPSEVFIHLSPARCWEMVRERVNHEITRQHKMGRMNLPPLQPPGGLDGMEMFGFSSPEILQAIQAMDRHRVCSEYWETRPTHSQSQDSGPNKTPNGQDQLPTEVDTILDGLFKKANPEELNALSSILSNNNKSTTDQGGLLARLVNEAILRRSSR